MIKPELVARTLRRLPPIALALLSGACSTLTQGTSQDIALTTPGVQGAVCHVTGGDGVDVTVTPPTTLKLPRSKRDIDVSCAVHGDPPVKQIVASTYAPRARFQHPLGYLVDGASGAMWVYPDQIEALAAGTAPIPLPPPATTPAATPAS